MYASSCDLQRHVKNGCPMEENSDENDTMSDISDKDDDRGFTSLVNEVWEENQPQFDKRLAQLMDENHKLSKTEVRDEVSEMMLSKDRNLFLKKYKRILVIFAQLNKSKLHREITKEVSTLVEKKDIDLGIAVSGVLNKYRQEFDQLLEADDSFYQDNTEEEAVDEETKE
jgi:hypothetical protein